MTLWAFLSAAIGPLAVRALLALGISVLTFTGVDLAWSGMDTYVRGAWSALPANLVQWLGYIGGGKALGLILGACSARVTMWAAAAATRFAVAA